MYVIQKFANATEWHRAADGINDFGLKIKKTDRQNALGLLFTTALFGLGMMKIKRSTESILENLTAFHETVLVFWRYIIKFLPVGLFFMTAGHVLSGNADCFQDVAYFLTGLVIAIAIHLLLVLPAIYCKKLY